MTLEHYPGMTESELARVEAEASARWPLQASLIVHRVGALKPGDNIVLVVTASAHRQAAFEAAEFLMDYLKTRAPFWKKEAGADGAARWVDARDSDDAAAGAVDALGALGLGATQASECLRASRAQGRQIIDDSIPEFRCARPRRRVSQHVAQIANPAPGLIGCQACSPSFVAASVMRLRQLSTASTTRSLVSNASKSNVGVALYRLNVLEDVSEPTFRML